MLTEKVLSMLTMMTRPDIIKIVCKSCIAYTVYCKS